MRIKLSYSFTYLPIGRQLPGTQRSWGNNRFVFDSDPDANDGPFDAWVIYNNLPSSIARTIDCPRERTILVLGEPPSRVSLHPQFAGQFGQVVTCHQVPGSSNIRPRQQSLPWWIGLRRRGRTIFDVRLTYDDLQSMTAIAKPATLSIVCSSLDITPFHRKRIRFVRQLIAHFGNRLTVFGEGFTPVMDKWDAISPFRYHIVIENCTLPHYWTEKLADAFLGAAFPIYCGAPNIHEYFSPLSLQQIDIEKPGEAIALINDLLKSDPYERRKAAIWEARKQILDEYNLFPSVVSLLERTVQGAQSACTMIPAQGFAPTSAMRWSRIAHLAREGATRNWLRLTNRI